ncbi:DUF1553 domain-containing protein [Urbifossiella limnaea]|uniref:Bacterial Ig-like domain (Group 2) n=1 Tax=Urbifossiella limnaea TaxID=2528023 RepID=A0A517XUG7_9BACT|nr:DUF1553 domain-containing protein [Urbifossiella limnaea]QDU21147.1 Bacterial Ig-like domain (group 2) [Urbifossiella limnaea]
MRQTALGLVLLLAPGVCAAGELKVYPPAVAVSGPNRVQQLLVVEEENGRVVADHTTKATYTSSTTSVAKVTADGLVTAVGDGDGTVTVTVNGRSLQVKLTASTGVSGWGFRNHVVPTLTRTGCNSGACHGALAGKGGLKLSLRGYDPDADHFALTRQVVARRVDLARPADSLMLQKATRALPHAGGTRFEADSDHHALLLQWVTAGATVPAAAEPELVRLDVFPRAALLKPRDTVRVVVRAVYANGTVEDVTRWAKFVSSEEQAATVTEDGVVTVVGHGEAAVSVLFGTKVAALTVTAPFATPVDAAAFTPPAGAGFVDVLVLKKLQLLRVAPNGTCSDSEFVRRVFLDVCGVLPKPEETAAFLADTDARKRERLIDRLLDRPEYVDYWTMKWSDLLLVSSRRLPQPAMWAFYRSVRQSVADNQPWDRFARDILTASGSTLTNGRGNYFVLHRDVSDLAESTAVTFMGTSITCARCHNHPLERWTQDQYWQFANLFARVGLKNGDRPGEVLIQPRADGDALHLRRGVAMPPTPLDGKAVPEGDSRDRRVHFTDWLTAAENPYFARAAVNRVWKSLMGRGLVETEDDLRDTNPATNVELLDALAADFVTNRFDVKHLIRTVTRSAAYQRASRASPANAADDRFYSRYLLRRLPAEVILDAYSDVTGVPTAFNQLKSAAGDSTTPTTSYPLGTRAMQLPDSLAVSRFLEAFGRPERVATCSCERTADASVGQALHLNNGQTLNEKLRSGTSVVARWVDAKLSDREVVDRLYLAALSRAPTAEERDRFVGILAEAGRESPAARREALEDFAWAVLTGREFLFNH